MPLTGRLPKPAAIVAALASPSPGESGADERGDVIVGLALRLHQNNRAQWEREDDARQSEDDDAAIAAAKRDIDRLNGVRHGLIEAIDRAVLHAVPQPDDRAPLVTETPGMVVDRLSVLVLRLASTEARATAAEANEGELVARLARVRRQLDVLEEAASVLFTNVENGRCRFVTYESLKLYGPGGEPRPR